MENFTNAHTILVAKVLIELGKNSDKVRAWKNHTGSARSMDGQRIIQYGLKGSADITGILKNGKRLELEIKTGHAVQAKHQENFQRMIEEMGGVYKVIRNEKDIYDLI